MHPPLPLQRQQQQEGEGRRRRSLGLGGSLLAKPKPQQAPQAQAQAQGQAQEEGARQGQRLGQTKAPRGERAVRQVSRLVACLPREVRAVGSASRQGHLKLEQTPCVSFLRPIFQTCMQFLYVSCIPKSGPDFSLRKLTASQSQNLNSVRVLKL